jgi:xanthine dehydrogenase accessory factor
MRDLIPEIERWRQAGKQVAVATIVQVYGSALRPLGSKMACSSAGDIAGSVSGGCIEGAVYEEAQKVMKHGRPKLLEYGVANESAWEIGLACGGTIQVWVESLAPEIYTTLKQCLDAGQIVALATIIAGPGMGNKLFIWPDGRTQGELGSADLTERVIRYAADWLAAHDPGRAAFDIAGEPVDIFVEVFPPLPRLIIVGAVHIAIPLVTFAKTLGFHTIVLDARSAFATRERFPHAEEMIVEWPSTAMARLNLDEATYVVVVTHDDKLDIPALQAALASPARYIGILGSTTSHAKRIQALKQLGVSDEQLARIRAPIGLDVGAVGPEEIALSIMAEVVAVRHGIGSRQPRPLSDHV